MMAVWNRAVDLESAKKRFTEERIVDPLRLTVGEGSFLEQFAMHSILAESCPMKIPRSILNHSLNLVKELIKREPPYKTVAYSVYIS